MWEKIFSGEHLVLWQKKLSRGTVYAATRPWLEPAILAQGYPAPVHAVKAFIEFTEDPMITESWHEFYTWGDKDHGPGIQGAIS